MHVQVAIAPASSSSSEPGKQQRQQRQQRVSLSLRFGARVEVFEAVKVDDDDEH